MPSGPTECTRPGGSDARRQRFCLHPPGAMVASDPRLPIGGILPPTSVARGALLFLPVALTAQPMPGAVCRPAFERQGEAGCWIVRHDRYSPPDGVVWWNLDAFADSGSAARAATPGATVLQALGRGWRLTIADGRGPASALRPAPEHVARWCPFCTMPYSRRRSRRASRHQPADAARTATHAPACSAPRSGAGRHSASPWTIRERYHIQLVAALEGVAAMRGDGMLGKTKGAAVADGPR